MFRVRRFSSKSLLWLSKKGNFQCGCFISNWQGGRQSKKETFYDELGVSTDASERDIKKAYLELCKKYHPDSDVEDKSLHEKFVRINAAYDVLCKPSERKQYDQALKAGFNPQPGEVNTTETWNPKHPQYYYHPRFYADPKMREAAAKVWEADTGWSFSEYYEHPNSQNTHKVTSQDKVLGISIAVCLMIFGSLLGLRVYNNAKNMLALEKEKSPEKFIQHIDNVSRGTVVRRLDRQASKANAKSEYDIELKDPYLSK